MKISIVTAVLNRADSIAQSISSVQAQTHADTEHLIIDGESTDGTLDILKIYANSRTIVISEPDDGIYHALNKGFALATGDVIGIMHSDDFYANDSVLSDVAKAFESNSIDVVYGDLDYVAKSNPRKILRHWRAGEFSPQRLAWGWMPPHPTLFIRRSLIDKWGAFDTRFRIAADYDAILRYFNSGKARPVYIPRVLVKMRLGGESNMSLAKIMLKSREDLAALRQNGIGGLGALFWKNLSKIQQLYSRPERESD